VANPGEHNEIHEVTKLLAINDPSIVLYHLAKGAYECCPEERERIARFVEGFLD